MRRLDTGEFEDRLVACLAGQAPLQQRVGTLRDQAQAAVGEWVARISWREQSLDIEALAADAADAGGKVGDAHPQAGIECRVSDKAVGVDACAARHRQLGLAPVFQPDLQCIVATAGIDVAGRVAVERDQECIVAAAACHVDTTVPGQAVLAFPAVEPARRTGSGEQAVVAIAADERIAAFVVGQEVAIAAAVELVVTASAEELVASWATAQDIVPGAAIEPVVRVEERGPATLEDVVTAQAEQGVAAFAPVEAVGEVAAVENVRTGRAAAVHGRRAGAGREIEAQRIGTVARQLVAGAILDGIVAEGDRVGGPVLQWRRRGQDQGIA